MSFWLRIVSVCLLASAASLACSGGVYSEEAGVETEGGESVASVQEAVDQACVNQCMQGCVCAPDERPATCRRICLAECREACDTTCYPSCAGKPCGGSDGCGGVCSAGSCPAGTTCGGGGIPNQCGCTASCAGKACGASDGCGGICTAGSCPGGAACGGGGVPGLCGLPNLNASMTATLISSPFLVKKAKFDVLVRNMGPVGASNIELLFQTNLTAFIDQLTTTNGFVCQSLAEYQPRLGLRCYGGSIPRFDTARIQMTLALPTSGFNVLSLLSDSNFTIVELDEGDNLANAGVMVP